MTQQFVTPAVLGYEKTSEGVQFPFEIWSHDEITCERDSQWFIHDFPKQFFSSLLNNLSLVSGSPMTHAYTCIVMTIH